MPSELALPSVLTELDIRLLTDESSVEDIAQVLRALQRLGMPKQDIEVHLERVRAVNDVTARNPHMERNALLAMDLVIGEGGELSLTWDAREIARIYVPRAVGAADLTSNTSFALMPSDMLPPRPGDTVPESRRDQAVNDLVRAEAEYEYAPYPADVCRVPKDAFTTRPAALLAMADRLVLEALAGSIEAQLPHALPDEVIWPRSRDQVVDAELFRTRPLQWSSSYIVKADIERYFENVDHSLLVMILASQLNATSDLTQAIEGFLGTVMHRSVGLPQGPVGSDILASSYLLLIDLRLHKEGWIFTRFADDYFIAAESMAEGRRKIEILEGYLWEHGLNLSASKTRIMRRATYERALSSPPPAIAAVKARLRRQNEEYLLNSDDPDAVGELLGELSEDDQIVWDVMYHGTKSIIDAIEELGDRLGPSTETVYKVYLSEIDRLLRSDEIPEDMASIERVAKECVAFMTIWKEVSVAPEIARLLAWFPSLGAAAAGYYLSASEKSPSTVESILLELIASAELPDWTRAFLCQAVRDRSGRPSDALLDQLRDIVVAEGGGLLTRAAAAWALAAHGELTRELFMELYRSSSEPIRGDLRVVAISSPASYPWFPSDQTSEILGPQGADSIGMLGTSG